MFRRLAPLLVLFFISALPLQANKQVPSVGSSKEVAPVKAELISEVESIEPGRPFRVAVKLDMQEGWDTIG